MSISLKKAFGKDRRNNDPEVNNDLPHEDGSELEQAEKAVKRKPKASQLPAEPEHVEPHDADLAKNAAEDALNAEIAEEAGKRTLAAEKKANKAHKFPHLVEISVRAVGMVPCPSHTVDLDSTSAAELAVVLDDLIEQLKAELL